MRIKGWPSEQSRSRGRTDADADAEKAIATNEVIKKARGDPWSHGMDRPTAFDFERALHWKLALSTFLQCRFGRGKLPAFPGGILMHYRGNTGYTWIKFLEPKGQFLH